MWAPPVLTDPLRVKRLFVSAELVLQLLGGNDPLVIPGFVRSVKQSWIPKDAKIIGAEWQSGHRVIMLFIESESFPEVLKGAEIPTITDALYTETLTPVAELSTIPQRDVGLSAAPAASTNATVAPGPVG